MRKPIALIAAALMAVALAAPVQAKPDFAITSVSTTFDHATSTITWTIKFTAKPDFYTLDQSGRQANAFRIVLPDEVVYAGDEIHVNGTIPIRRLLNGNLVTELPYTQHGKTVTFQSGNPSFHQSQFDFTLESLVYGASTDIVQGVVLLP